MGTGRVAGLFGMCGIIEMTTAKPATIESVITRPFRLALNVSAFDLTEENILQLSSDNRVLRLELTAAKELIIMSPADTMTGWRSGQVAPNCTLGPIWMELASPSAPPLDLPCPMELYVPLTPPGSRYRGGNHCPVESRKGSDTVALIS